MHDFAGVFSFKMQWDGWSWSRPFHFLNLLYQRNSSKVRNIRHWFNLSTKLQYVQCSLLYLLSFMKGIIEKWRGTWFSHCMSHAERLKGWERDWSTKTEPRGSNDKRFAHNESRIEHSRFGALYSAPFVHQRNARLVMIMRRLLFPSDNWRVKNNISSFNCTTLNLDYQEASRKIIHEIWKRVAFFFWRTALLAVVKLIVLTRHDPVKHISLS